MNPGTTFLFLVMIQIASAACSRTKVSGSEAIIASRCGIAGCRSRPSVHGEPQLTEGFGGGSANEGIVVSQGLDQQRDCLIAKIGDVGKW